MELADEVEEQLAAALGERKVAGFVEDDGVHAGEVAGGTSVPPAGFGLEPVDEIELKKRPRRPARMQLRAMATARRFLPDPSSRNCAQGCEGGYDAVWRHARTWSKDHAAASATPSVPLTFAPGEVYQFDWEIRFYLGLRAVRDLQACG